MKILSFLIFFTFISGCRQQETPIPTIDPFEGGCCPNYEQYQKPVTGYEEYLRLVRENIDQKNIQGSITGRVYVRFLVDTEGNTKEFKVIKSNCMECDNEILNAFKRVNIRWEPYRMKGVAKSVYCIMHIDLDTLKVQG